MPKNDSNLSNTKINDNWVLKEILHQPVTFTANSIHKDTDDLNKVIRKGYSINEIVRTETGIVYVLSKWEKQSITKKTNQQLKKQRNSWNVLTG